MLPAVIQRKALQLSLGSRPTKCTLLQVEFCTGPVMGILPRFPRVSRYYYIITIINVLIKVTLNEIRCRGTLQSRWSTLTDSTSLYIKAEESVNVTDESRSSWCMGTNSSHSTACTVHGITYS